MVRTECWACMSVHTRTRMQLVKMDKCQCTGPFGWTDKPEKALRPFSPKPSSWRPWCKTHPTQVEEKDCEARPPHLPLLRRGGCAIFSISSALDAPGSRMDMRRSTWTCLLGKPDPFSKVTTWIRKMTRSANLTLTTSITNPGKRPRGKTSGKNSGTVTKLKGAIQKLQSRTLRIPQNIK